VWITSVSREKGSSFKVKEREKLGRYFLEMHSHDARSSGPVGDGASGPDSDRSPPEIGPSTM